MRFLHAEWSKLRTVPGNLALLAAVPPATVALSATVTATVHVDQCPSPAECFEDTTRLGLSGVHVGQLVVIVLAVLAISSEYGTGMIRTTFTAMPGRLRVLAAKTVVVTGAVLAAAVVAVAGSVVVTRAILRGNGFSQLLPAGDEPALRAAVGTVLYLGLIAVLSLGVAALLRDAAVAISAVIGLLYVFPVLSRFVDSELIDTYAPLTAGLAVQSTIGLDQSRLGPWAGLGVLALWAGAAALGGGVRFVLRDP